MTILDDKIKPVLGEGAEKLEQTITPYYTNLESWQRGLILIALALFLIFVIYQLTKPEPKLNAKKEAQIEEKILRQMAFFKRLRE
ncbi:MAG: hypothetical protein MRERV_4c059 [Mycoplasmataceae bacterium RV_VA103A]|nr:MAG: hypothetical protein MRERV_11c020 [Mycoplasmataceae bacterium RV_VA103A]KLL05162.1 MAG: hypothetical protein MRERV_4c059 [Mycoplasmataceae bacterium RV_VA103A]